MAIPAIQCHFRGEEDEDMKTIAPLLIATAMTALAARPVATITTSKEFTLSGVRIPATSVSSWPLTIGDEVGNLTSPAVIRFADNTQVSVAPGSRVKLETAAGQTVVRLTDGSLNYRPGASQNVRVFALDQQLEREDVGARVNGGHAHKSGRGDRQHEGRSWESPGPPGKPPGRSQGE